MNYCKKCILPETYPGITFNEEGICNYCLEYQPRSGFFGKEKLITELNSIKKNGKYDCLVPLSGGKDSTYILYFAVKELGLKPLAVSYNSGFQNEIATSNVRNACSRLAVKLVEVHSPGNLQTKMLKASYKLSQKYNSPWAVCSNCEPNLRMISINTARKFNIPCILWGSSGLESRMIKKEPEKNTGLADLVLQKSWKKTAGKIAELIIKQPVKIIDHIPYYSIRIRQRIKLGYPLRYIINPLNSPSLDGELPRFIKVFEYIQWDSISNVKLLVNELGWQYPGEIDTRFDCYLHVVGNRKRLKEWGISSDGTYICNFIREGKMSREEGLRRESIIENHIEDEYAALLEKIL